MLSYVLVDEMFDDMIEEVNYLKIKANLQLSED